jgi:hypothetical protein
MLRSWELSDQPKDSTEEQVREMAKLSLMSNKINEIQEKNLKMFPFIFFDGVKSVKIDYDLSNNQTIDTEENAKDLEISYKFNKLETNHFRVSYYLTIEEKVDNLLIDKRYSAIEQSVRNLFWKETRVEIYIDNELKYRSK